MTATNSKPQAAPSEDGALKVEGKKISGATWTIAIVLIGMVAFGIWSNTMLIDEVTRAYGQVIAAARTQVIQAADSGVLEKLFVEEGQAVEKGQLVALLEQSRAQASYEDSLNKVAALRAMLTRLRAEVYGTKLTFPPELEGYPNFRRNQRLLFQRRQKALHEGIAAIKKTRKLVRAELSVLQPLVEGGDAGKVELIRLQRQESELDGKLVNVRNTYFRDAQKDMTAAEEELAAQEQLLRERTTLLSHTELRAPMDGVVKEIEITTLGAAVSAGDIVLTMLPTTSELIIEAKFNTADVASLKLGLPATIKLDAYDFSIYGSAEGEVIYISPDALKEVNPRSGEGFYYRVQVRVLSLPEKTGPGNRPMEIDPGMTAMVEVRTRKRTVFSYLSKPITKTLNESMGER